MNPERDRDFDQNIHQLILLLKRILKNIPQQGGFPQLPSGLLGKDGAVNLNLCFFTFLPLSPEDYEDLEDIYDQYFAQEEKAEEFQPGLTPSDIEFLRQHGIRF